MLQFEDFYLLEDLISESAETTQRFATKIVDSYLKEHPLSIILMEGEMGAGKTTMVHGFGDALGVESVINSPTFNLLNQYRGKEGELFHYDLYRLGSSVEVEELGFADQWSTTPENGRVIHVVEWWTRADDLFPYGVETLLVEIKIDETNIDGPRKINVYRRK